MGEIRERLLSSGGGRGHRMTLWLPRPIIRLFAHQSLLYLIPSVCKTLDKAMHTWSCSHCKHRL